MAPQETPKNSVTVSPAAFVTMVRHSSKHSHDAVHGVLLGSYDLNKIQVKEAVPVCHGAPTQPLVETALGLVVEQQATSPGDSIVGWYTSPRLLRDDRPGPAALKIVSGLAKDDVEPTLLVVSNEGLGRLLKGEDDSLGDTLKALGKDFGKQWLDPLEIRVEEKAGAIKAAREAIQSELPLDDLLDHFDADPKTSKWYPNETLRSFVDKHAK